MVVRLCDDRERAVVDLWRRGHLAWSTIQVYLRWVRRFKTYCDKRVVDRSRSVVVGRSATVRQNYAGPRLDGRRSARSSRESARNAIHAWACALRSLGALVPAWKDKPEPLVLPPLLNEYCEYRRAHAGVAEATLTRDIDTVQRFLQYLRGRRRMLDHVALVDIDGFIGKNAERLSRARVADICSSLRVFLRFLRTTGRLRADLASGVMAPRFRASA